MSNAGALPRLTPNQINALVVLMVEARELTNNDLRELAGFALTGADNAKLVKLGLVSTDRTHRPFSHELTEQGWHVARRLHAATPPRQGGSATRSLLTVLANVHRSLDQRRISPAEFFRPTDAVQEDSADAPGEVHGGAAAATGDLQALIRAAYRELAVTPGGWVGLADLRELLDEHDREVVDDALRAMVRSADVRIIPVANTKALTPRDRAAALRIGDEENHALSIGPA